MLPEVPEISIGEVILWVLRLRWRYRVTGASMSPLLAQDDQVMVSPLRVSREVQVGDVVVARHPYRRDVRLIKLVTAVRDGGASFFLEGLNPAQSTDSHSFGAVPRRHILGRVTSRFP